MMLSNKFLLKIRSENIPFLSQMIFHQLLSQLHKYYPPKHPNLHILGDSHATSFSHPKNIVHYIGPATAFNLLKNSSQNNNKLKLGQVLRSIPNKPNASILLVFGEIDCRLHIFYQHKKTNTPLKKIVSNTANNYQKAIQYIQSFGFKHIFILSVNPPGEQPNIYNYPYYASRKQMVNITKHLNQKLKRWCRTQNANVHFIDIYRQLITPAGKRKRELILDSIHFNRKIRAITLRKIGDLNLE